MKTKGIFSISQVYPIKRRKVGQGTQPPQKTKLASDPSKSQKGTNFDAREPRERERESIGRSQSIKNEEGSERKERKRVLATRHSNSRERKGKERKKD